MSTTQPFAAPGDNPFARANITEFRERNTHSPSFYTPPPWEVAQRLIVTKDGKPIAPGFVLAEVAPERWYAVQESGEVMEQRDFEQHHERAFLEHYLIRDREPEDPSVRHIPNVVDFVSFRICTWDPSKLERIFRDDIALDTPAPEIKPIYSMNGELLSDSEGMPTAPAGYEAKDVAVTDDKGEDIEAKIEAMRAELAEMQAAKAERERAEKAAAREAEQPEPATPSVPAAEIKAPPGKLEAQKAASNRSQTMHCGTKLKSHQAESHAKTCAVCKAHAQETEAEGG